MSALIEAVNLPDSETAVSALSKFLLQKCEHIQQAGPPFLEDDDFYEEVKVVGLY